MNWDVAAMKLSMEMQEETMNVSLLNLIKMLWFQLITSKMPKSVLLFGAGQVNFGPCILLMWFVEGWIEAGINYMTLYSAVLKYGISKKCHIY